jgi:hypothetical protein
VIGGAVVYRGQWRVRLHAGRRAADNLVCGAVNPSCGQTSSAPRLALRG